MRTLSHVFFLDPSPVRRVPIQTGIQRKLNFVSVRTIKGSSSSGAERVGNAEFARREKVSRTRSGERNDRLYALRVMGQKV